MGPGDAEQMDQAMTNHQNVIIHFWNFVYDFVSYMIYILNINSISSK